MQAVMRAWYNMQNLSAHTPPPPHCEDALDAHMHIACFGPEVEAYHADQSPTARGGQLSGLKACNLILVQLRIRWDVSCAGLLAQQSLYGRGIAAAGKTSGAFAMHD